MERTSRTIEPEDWARINKAVFNLINEIIAAENKHILMLAENERLVKNAEGICGKRE